MSERTDADIVTFEVVDGIRDPWNIVVEPAPAPLGR